MMIMASSLPFSLSSSLFYITLTLILLFNTLPQTHSTSRHVFKHHRKQPTSFRFALKHIDSGKNLTRFQRLQHGVKRSKLRLQRLNALSKLSEGEAAEKLQSPVHAGNGEFLMDLAIGTPPESYLAIVDTGSDLIWTQCKPCTQCYHQPTPIFDPQKSSTFSKMSCTSSLCEALPESTCKSDRCEYLYSYGDESFTVGVMGTETFTLGKVSVPKIGFGCGADNEGDGFKQGGGLVGLGRGNLSLVSQLKVPKFSYCLTSMDDDVSASSKSTTSTLIMGSFSLPSNGTSNVKTTPLIKNPSQPSFYYLSLEGITVGGDDLPIKKSTLALNSDGSGGMIIDSGTTITYLEESVFDMVKKAFISQTKLDVDTSSSESIGLDLCFRLPDTQSMSGGSTVVEIPRLLLNFEGASLELPGENYMIGDSDLGVVCLAMGSSQGMSIFGNVQQQNMMVVHDLEMETLSFLPTKCDQL